MARKRFNRAAICSSENYRKSRLLHAEFLKEKHSHFNGIYVTGKVSFYKPILKKGKVVTDRGRKITVWGKDMMVTEEEYRIHCAHLGL